MVSGEILVHFVNVRNWAIVASYMLRHLHLLHREGTQQIVEDPSG
jgi:hypothetical protein